MFNIHYTTTHSSCWKKSNADRINCGDCWLVTVDYPELRQLCLSILLSVTSPVFQCSMQINSYLSSFNDSIYNGNGFGFEMFCFKISLNWYVGLWSSLLACFIFFTIILPLDNQAQHDISQQILILCVAYLRLCEVTFVIVQESLHFVVFSSNQFRFEHVPLLA